MDRTLWTAVLDNPESRDARLAVARALEGDPRGELITLQLATSDPDLAEADRWVLRRRADALLEQHGTAWAAEIAPKVTRHKFWRGFVEQITLDAAQFVADADVLRRLAPIRIVVLENVSAELASRLAATPALAQIVKLSLSRSQLTDDALLSLLQSPHLGRLISLELDGNRITRRGIEAVCATIGPHLVYVGLTGPVSMTPSKDMVSIR